MEGGQSYKAGRALYVFKLKRAFQDHEKISSLLYVSGKFLYNFRI
jgi:hypothetical protein